MSRPLFSFNGFVGQREIVDPLRALAQGVIRNSEVFPHTAFVGPSGTGKTHLAEALAKELDRNCIPFLSSPQSKKWQLAELFMAGKNGDVFFIDEIHSLPTDSQELLFPAIDKLRVPEVDAAKHRVKDNEWIDIQPFTLVVATDKPGMLLNALKQRIVLRFAFTRYSLEEMRQIAFNYASSLNILLTPQAATRIAEAARGLPRRARHLLSSVKTTLPDPGLEVSKTFIDEHLSMCGTDADNLRPEDRRYLRVLAIRNGSVSLKCMSIQIGFDSAYIESDIEGNLIERGLVSIEPRGRILTPAGRQFCSERGLA